MTEKRSKNVSLLILGVHWAILLNFLFQMGYAAYMVFVVVAPEGGGPLFENALSFPFESMVTRRLYAIEFWIATTGFAIYVGLTEIKPRLWNNSSNT
jgi:hypothetical protein